MGDFYSINEFYEMLVNNCITDYDGIGYYVTASGHETNDKVDFIGEYFKARAEENNYSGVMWYNK